MNNKISLFVMSASLFFNLIACSDSSSPSVPEEVIGDTSSDGNLEYSSSLDFQLYSSSSIVYSSNNNQSSFSVDNLQGAYTPSASLSINISGVAEMGPYKSGSTISIYGLDTTTMKTSSTSVNSTIINDKGEYSAQGTLTSNYGSVVVNGSYYNFYLQDYANISLKALADLKNKSVINVNLLTRLAYDRIVYLVANDSMSFSKAKEKAEKEVLSALGLYYDETPFEDISLNTDGISGYNLIKASIAFSINDDATNMAEVISAVASDIAQDGTWDDVALKTQIADALYKQNKYSIVNIIKSAIDNNTITVKGLGPFNFWAYQYGIGECTEENDGVTAINTNTLSANYNATFLCSDSSWTLVSATILFSKEVSEVLGECTTAKEGTSGTYKDENVICKKGYWQKMSEDELVNEMVSKEKGVCSSSNDLSVVQINSIYYQCFNSSWAKLNKTPIDYSKGREMNKLLGRGINFGNSWDSPGTGGSGDCGWSNCIDDGWFKIAKDAGFNSIRLPVRWENDASGSTINSARLNGVKADIDLALAQGLVVIVNFHHHDILNEAAANYSSNPSTYNSEKQKFVNMWSQVASALNSYGDKQIVFEILNEPHDIQVEQVNDLMNSAYKVIRQNAPNKTIMFEGGGYSKFAQIPNLNLPEDGNIIVTAHYYDPYTLSHQGHGYDYSTSATFNTSTINNDFKAYRDSIAKAFPDVGGGFIPVNMGEFGIATTNSGSGVSEATRASWSNVVIQNAEKYGFSWHYWGFAGVGGFEAYNKNSNSWYPEIKAVFDKYL